MPKFKTAKRDGLILLLSLFILLIAGFMTENDEALYFAGRPLPPLCWFRQVTGLKCPTCGLSRSFVAWLDGNAVRAWQWHPLAIGLLGPLVFQIPYRLRIMVTGRRVTLFSDRKFLQCVSYLYLGSFLLIWLVRLLNGLALK